MLQFAASHQPPPRPPRSSDGRTTTSSSMLHLARIRQVVTSPIKKKSCTNRASLCNQSIICRATLPPAGCWVGRDATHPAGCRPIASTTASCTYYQFRTGMPEIVPSASRRCRNENHCLCICFACRYRGPSGWFSLTSHREYRAPFSACPSNSSREGGKESNGKGVMIYFPTQATLFAAVVRTHAPLCRRARAARRSRTTNRIRDV
jgi:hypothetical protein